MSAPIVKIWQAKAAPKLFVDIVIYFMFSLAGEHGDVVCAHLSVWFYLRSCPSNCIAGF